MDNTDGNVLVKKQSNRNCASVLRHHFSLCLGMFCSSFLRLGVQLSPDKVTRCDTTGWLWDSAARWYGVHAGKRKRHGDVPTRDFSLCKRNTSMPRSPRSGGSVPLFFLYFTRNPAVPSPPTAALPAAGHLPALLTPVPTLISQVASFYYSLFSFSF